MRYFAVLLLGACAPPLGLPFSRIELALHDSARALVHYLGQPDASAAACGRDPHGFHVTATALDADGFDDLVTALARGRVRSGLWRLCVAALLERAPLRLGSAYADVVLRALPDRVDDRTPEGPARLAALLGAYRDRPAALISSASLRARTAEALREEKRIGRATEALLVVEAESGLWQGKRVSGDVLDELFRRHESSALAALAARLPDEALRREARRRIVRQRILDAASFPELRAKSAEIEEAVLRDGRYAVPLERHPVAHASIDAMDAAANGVVLVQDALNQLVSLRLAPGRPEDGLLPLPQHLWFRIEGFANGITVCSAKRGLDPTPCVAGAALSIESAPASIDADGVLRLTKVPTRTALDAFRAPGARLTLPVRAAGRVVATLSLPVRWAPPESLAFVGPRHGGAGPNLHLHVRHGPRIELRVTGAEREILALVEEADFARLALVSRGARGVGGVAGMSGMSGSSGASGSSASCPSTPGENGQNGGDGSDGSPGGPGGPGGRGGGIHVTFSCGDAPCAGFEQTLHAIVRSEGGAGGPGGPGGMGGTGGNGGSGGSGTTCTNSDGSSTYLSGGSSGMSGRSGSSGPPGPDGPPGEPGVVRIERAEGSP